MSKFLDATCEDKKVTIQGQIVECELISEGIGKSSGKAFLEGNEAFYITSNATDLKESIEKISEALSKISEALTAIGSGMMGALTAPPPTLPTATSAIDSIVSELSQLSEALK